MIWHSEQPKLNTYSWFVNELASNYVKVCLSGLGGDELFFGYATSSRYENFRNAQKLMKLPAASIVGKFVGGRKSQVISNVKNRAATYLSTISPIYGEESKYFAIPADGYRKNLTERIEKKYFASKSDFLQQAFDAELETKLPDDFLSIDDTMSMAHSLENRVPLLDNTLIDLIRPVPYRYNYVNGQGKYLLRQAMKGILPESVFSKPKQGFSLDIVKWWHSELGEEIRRTISDSKVVKKYFAIDTINETIAQAKNSYSKVSLLSHVYSFHVWHEIFVQGKRPSREVTKKIAAPIRH
jgi:asparagine synthase (glutamine-hydrolysing)